MKYSDNNLHLDPWRNKVLQLEKAVVKGPAFALSVFWRNFKAGNAA